MKKIAGSIIVVTLLLLACTLDRSSDWDWDTYLGDKASTQHSPLSQIDRENVHQLELAWHYKTGDARDNNRSQIQCNPLIIEGVLYGTSPRLKLFALDAVTGEELWVFDPYAGSNEEDQQGVNRGVVYWGEGSDKRILYTASHYIYAVNAENGTLISNFGDGGKVDLQKGLDREQQNIFVGSNSPGVIYNNILIQGTRVGEGPGKAAPGHIRAFDVRTGETRWIFHTIPHPGEFGNETWPENSWKNGGGANAWSGLSLDEERGWVFVPTGSPAFDFWGGNRAGQNLFGNCLLVLNAETGERIWHFQFVHHDLWDRDLPAPPNLVKVKKDGRVIDAVAQVTKSGHLFLFDRETGDPLFPIQEVSVPESDLLGEKAWPTQPLPSHPAPYARQAFNETDISDVNPDSREDILKRFSGVRTGQQFIPPSVEGTMIFPGFDGGAEWGGAAFDPETGYLYVNSNEMPWILKMVDMEAKAAASAGEKAYMVNCAVCHGENFEGDPSGVLPPINNLADKYSEKKLSSLIESGRGFMPGFPNLNSDEKQAIINYMLKKEVKTEVPEWAVPPGGVPYTHTGYNRFLDSEGYPAIKPPWGTLNAIDLNTGDYVWTVPLGEYSELTERGIPVTGTENYGGPLVTAGGILFIAATKDEKFRAFDKTKGEILWESQLPAGGYATPSTYQIDGRQFVVIAAGGGKMGTKSGDSYLAFTLPVPQP